MADKFAATFNAPLVHYLPFMPAGWADGWPESAARASNIAGNVTCAICLNNLRRKLH